GAGRVDMPTRTEVSVRSPDRRRCAGLEDLQAGGDDCGEIVLSRQRLERPVHDATGERGVHGSESGPSWGWTRALLMVGALRPGCWVSGCPSTTRVAATFTSSPCQTALDRRITTTSGGR